jgi:hypothetical protein
MTINQIIPSSFRDPSGFVFSRDGAIYRQVNKVYKDHYECLIESGLYQSLSDSGLMVSHQEVGLEYAQTDDAYKVLRMQTIPFISYPYEWCFSQLKDAAFTSLKVQKTAFEHGMTLKDSSAYNIQFFHGKPVFIDTFSFERWKEGQLWTPYKQFCQHFLAPLALMSKRDVRLNQLFKIYIDGIPLDLASSLLSFRTCFQFSLLTHIHLHAWTQKRFANKTVSRREPKISRLSFMGLIDNLETAVKKLKWHRAGTEWGDYYDYTNYSSQAMDHKRKLVAEFMDEIEPAVVWDLGANTGVFSTIAAERGIRTMAFDIDPAAVEIGYRRCKENRQENIMPLLLDLTNPSPGIGWANRERDSLLDRRSNAVVFALALIHHLAISNNIPLTKIAEFLSDICSFLIIEFVPKSDSQVKKLLCTREDVFPDYTLETFEKVFLDYFKILKSVNVSGTERTLFLMQNGREL